MMEILDISDTIVVKSDQLNSEDLISGEKTITVSRVTKNAGADQPLFIYYEGDNGKPFKPCLTMRKILMAIWGMNGNAWACKKLTLYRDADAAFGGQKVGGIRISHASDIDKDFKIMLTVSRGKKKEFVVKVLKAADKSLAVPEPTQYPQADFDAKFPAWESAIEVGALTAAVVISKAEQSGGTLTDAMKASINAVKIIPQSTPQEDF